MTRQRSRNLQHGWDALRSQLMARLEQQAPAPAEVEHVLRPEELQLFEDDAAEPYYGPTREARAAINSILGLGSLAGQREWEAELGDRAKLQALVDALAGESRDAETRSAIALLLLDYADGLGLDLFARLRWHLRRDPTVQARMRYWWTHMDGAPGVWDALA
jgi:hypothetical protein